MLTSSLDGPEIRWALAALVASLHPRTFGTPFDRHHRPRTRLREPVLRPLLRPPKRGRSLCLPARCTCKTAILVPCPSYPSGRTRPVTIQSVRVAPQMVRQCLAIRKLGNIRLKPKVDDSNSVFQSDFVPRAPIGSILSHYPYSHLAHLWCHGLSVIISVQLPYQERQVGEVAFWHWVYCASLRITALAWLIFPCPRFFVRFCAVRACAMRFFFAGFFSAMKILRRETVAGGVASGRGAADIISVCRTQEP